MNRVFVNWADAYGGTRLTWYSYADAGTVTPFGNALVDCVNPVPAASVDGHVVTSSDTPSTSPYAACYDSAVLTFVTAMNTLVGVVAPGFKESLYLGDNQTVDPAQPLVRALVAAALAVPLVDSAGNPVIGYIGGLRQKKGY